MMLKNQSESKKVQLEVEPKIEFNLVKQTSSCCLSSEDQSEYQLNCSCQHITCQGAEPPETWT